MNRTPMKRTAFKRAPSTTAKTESNRALALDERAQRAIKNAPKVGPDRQPRLDARAARIWASGLDAKAAQKPDLPVLQRSFVGPVDSDRPIVSIPKDLPIRSKAYLRLVAQLPCLHCGIPGHSQAAHSNTGKGMGLKACDLQTFPLCCDRPGQRGCHSLFDQGALFGKEARRLIEPAWVADTQRRIHAMGIWPKKYQFPTEALESKASAAINSEAP